MATTSKPVATFKLGRIQAAVWANDGNKGRFYSVTIERRYNDGGWKSSKTFSRNDLPLVAKVADQAHSWIYDQRPDSEDSVATDGDAPSGDSVVLVSDDELRARYLEQQARLACPGCGEEPFID